MAYIDTTKIMDISARTLIARSANLVTSALDLAELKVNDLCNRRQVFIGDIPLDEISGNIVSPTLYMYCYHYFLHYLYKSVMGTVEQDDLYSREAINEERRALNIEPEISYEVIMQKEVIDNVYRGNGIPIL